MVGTKSIKRKYALYVYCILMQPLGVYLKSHILCVKLLYGETLTLSHHHSKTMDCGRTYTLTLSSWQLHVKILPVAQETYIQNYIDTTQYGGQ